MTQKEFRNSPFRDQLFAFLLTDCGKHMLHLLERRPTNLPAVNGIHHTDAVVARMYAFDAGINHAAEVLKSLGEPWVDETDMAKASERVAWGDNIPLAMREAFEKYQREQPNQL